MSDITTSDSSKANVEKRKAEDKSEASTDHRKRRRNRTTQSCLNCHGSKRMCDRKRPSCGRCVKLGLSGICVYEVDDLNQRNVDQDETVHLKERIAELEGFIREFKKKPHPRWADDHPRRSATSSRSSPQPDPMSESSINPSWSSPSPRADDNGSSASSPSSLLLTPPMQGGDPIILSSPPKLSGLQTNNSLSLSSCPPYDVDSLRHVADDFASLLPFSNLGLSSDEGGALERAFAQILQSDAKRASAQEASSTFHQHYSCQCAKSSSVYSVVLELAPHVRRALDALSALPEHQRNRDSCEYFGNLHGLDNSTAAIVKAVSSSLTSSVASLARNASSAPSPVEPQLSSSLLAARNFGAAASFALPFPASVGRATDLGGAPQAQIPHPWSTTGAVRPPTENQQDRFMTWEPPAAAHQEWPRTIQL
ncbi:hypothetical protein SCHPADRAFT_894583 [Schizopora paradoxa]|uniref:Zn(2)-C6 fungal-type domain-containing protein n=1 Tax=Schizopora paradoxa TaxID=27342 RepID=A0A0H2RRT7_9AGAM|nr:hypothetical protein SCHPADRAFT_894583 [Schizopora paradoxa]